MIHTIINELIAAVISPPDNVCGLQRKRNTTIEIKAPTRDAKLEMNQFYNWILTQN